MARGVHTRSVLRVGGPDAVASAWEVPDDVRLFVRSVHTAEAALDVVEDVDCIVSDYDLPEIDGLGLLERVREAYPSLPFVLYGGDAAVAEAATAADVTAYVRAKPGRDDEATLRQRVQTVLGDGRPDVPGWTTPEQLLDSIFECVPVHLFVKDREGRHVKVSSAFVDDPGTFVGKTDAELDDVSDAHASQALADDRHVVATGEPILDKEEYLSSLDQWNLTSKVPWRDESGDVVGVIGVARDISARKRHREALERQNERLDDFASIVSHDLRNPLNVASGYLDLAREGEETAFDRIDSALGRMNDLIDDVLTLAREGHAVVDREAFSVQSAAEAAWETVGGEAEALTVTECVVRGDESRVQRLFENLFRNSVEHGATSSRAEPDDAFEHAGPDVTVVVGPLDASDGFFVEDDGPGIPESERETVFEAGVSGSADGTGFGLTIVRQIAEAHGWTVRAVEGDRGGARFEFRTGPSAEGQEPSANDASGAN
jgi:signal transduction histidine kinase/CheY-like chemotaxis protein